MDVASARLTLHSFTPVRPHLESSPHTCLSMEPKWPPLPLPMVFTLLASTSKLPPSRPLSILWFTPLSLTIILMPMEDSMAVASARLMLLSSLPDQLSLDLCLMLMLWPILRASLDPLPSLASTQLLSLVSHLERSLPPSITPMPILMLITLIISVMLMVNSLETEFFEMLRHSHRTVFHFTTKMNKKIIFFIRTKIAPQKNCIY